MFKAALNSLLLTDNQSFLFDTMAKAYFLSVLRLVAA